MLCWAVKHAKRVAASQNHLWCCCAAGWSLQSTNHNEDVDETMQSDLLLLHLTVRVEGQEQVVGRHFCLVDTNDFFEPCCDCLQTLEVQLQNHNQNGLSSLSLA